MKKANGTKPSLHLSSYLIFNGMKKSFPIAVGGRQAEILLALSRHPPKADATSFTQAPRGANHRARNASERIGVGDRDTTGSRKDGRQERIEQDGDLNRRRNGTDKLDKEDDKEKTVASARG